MLNQPKKLNALSTNILLYKSTAAIQIVGDIDFKVISAAENSNKFQIPRFWKEKSVEDVVILGPTAQPHKL
jgi:hypothetical protein